MAEATPGKRMCCSTTCFTLFVIVSLLTHIGEVFLNAVYIFYVYTDTVTPEWTTTTLGFLLLPIVVTQLFSALLHLQWRTTQIKDGAAKPGILLIAVLHVLQLGFVWRHLRILNERNSAHRKKFLVDLLLLRLVFAFTSSLPLLLLQTYFTLTTERYHGIQVAAMIVCLLSASWALASFRRQNEFCDIDKVILTWPGTVFRWLWRIGEVTSRLLSLAVFASVYHYWTLLVLGLHWLTMLICIWAAILGTVDRKDFSRGGHAMICVAIGYVYTFTHLNFNNHKARCRYVTYYSIIFLETCVLVTTWLLSNPTWRVNFKAYYLIAAIGSTFLLSVFSMTIYYGCFHIPISSVPKGNADVCIQDGCINCKLSLCAKHSKVLQRPFNTGWATQYQAAVYDGRYYKNVLQDSLLDSASELDERFRGNTSFNDREVELILSKSGSGSVNSLTHNVRDVTAEVESNRSSSHGNQNGGDPEQNSATLSEKNAVTISEAVPTASATSTIKSSLDLYNNLNSIQLDKSFETSSQLKSKALQDTSSLSGSLLQMNSEHWEGVTTDNNLRGYNLRVSCIGSSLKYDNDSDEGISAASPKPESPVLRSDGVCLNHRIFDSSVEDNNGYVSVSPKLTVTESTVPAVELRVNDSDSSNDSDLPWYDCVSEQESRGEPRSPDGMLTTDLSSYVYETDSDGNPEMVI